MSSMESSESVLSSYARGAMFGMVVNTDGIVWLKRGSEPETWIPMWAYYGGVDDWI